MKKLSLSVLLILLCTSFAQARRPGDYKEPRVRFGISYRYSLPLREQVTVKTDAVKESAWGSPYYKRGGELLFEGTVKIDRNWNTGLGIGYGSYDGSLLKTFKVYAKGERLYGQRPSRWFNYANLGTSLYPDNGAGLTAELGGGYRLAMTRRTRLDFTVGLEYLNLVGDAYDIGSDRTYPGAARLNRFGLTFGIAMHF